MRPKILVSVFNNLYTDQRVEKVCRTLFENGFRIELLGNNWKGSPEMSRPYFFERIILRSNILRFAYIEMQWKLFFFLLKRADHNTILLSNDLDTLLPNYFVSKIKKIPLVFDSHEIFTEQPSVQNRWVQYVWKFLQRFLVPNMRYMMTASESYASWFVENYKIKKPTVVRNLPKKLSPPHLSENHSKIILYQGALNPARGIEQAIEAMQFLDDTEFWIAGDGTHTAHFKTLPQKYGVEKKVRFLGNLSPENLRKITQKADLGLSIEENLGLSFYYTLPNKISDYIQARVPVLVSDFPEYRRIINDFGVGDTITSHNPPYLAQKMRGILEKGRLYYLKNLENACESLCWENEEPKILDLFGRVQKENFH